MAEDRWGPGCVQLSFGIPGRICSPVNWWQIPWKVIVVLCLSQRDVFVFWGESLLLWSRILRAKRTPTYWISVVWDYVVQITVKVLIFILYVRYFNLILEGTWVYSRFVFSWRCLYVMSRSSGSSGVTSTAHTIEEVFLCKLIFFILILGNFTSISMLWQNIFSYLGCLRGVIPHIHITLRVILVICFCSQWFETRVDCKYEGEDAPLVWYGTGYAPRVFQRLGKDKRFKRLDRWLSGHGHSKVDGTTKHEWHVSDINMYANAKID